MRASWPLRSGRPCIEVVLWRTADGTDYPRVLLADTGAGAADLDVELILAESDCLTCSRRRAGHTSITGAFAGYYSLFEIRVCVPVIGFDQIVIAAGVRSISRNFDGVAGYRFLNRFTFGNFGLRDQFGIEV